MADKPLRDYDDFAGKSGYIIVDGVDETTPGGKLKVPNYTGVADGYVLTKSSSGNTDDVVWAAPSGGGFPDPQKLVGQSAASGGSATLKVDYTAANGEIVTVSAPYWALS